MSSINPLGRLFNLARNASGGSNRISLRDASGVTFVVDTPANASTLTITEATASSGGTSQALAGLAEWYTQTSGVWTRLTSGISSNVLTVSGTPDLAVVFVPQGLLSDGFKYVACSHSAKITTAILSDLDVQRKPANLRSIYS